MPFKILFADNTPEFLRAWAEYLKMAGYIVYPAGSPEEARRILREEAVHLAILDLRLEDDDDDKDFSGLELAQQDEFRAIPKLILAAKSSLETARDALRPVLSGLPPAVDFVIKREGPDAMLRAVANALQTHLHLNPTLEICWNADQPISYAALVGALEPGLPTKTLAGRIEQLEDLLRMLFFRYSRVSIQRLLWSQAGRLALDVCAEAQEAEDQFIMVCGQTDLLRADRARCQESPPHLSTLIGAAMAGLRETVNYAGWSWSITRDGDVSEEVNTLGEIFRTRPERVARAALETLFEKILLPWLRQGKTEQEDRLGAVFSGFLGLDRLGEEPMRARLAALARLSLERGLLEISFADEKVDFAFRGGQVLSLPDPLVYLYGEQAFDGPRVLLANSPGALDWDTILVSSQDRCWLSDYSRVGRAPLWDSFVSLEASLRFKYVDTGSLQDLYYFEKSLLNADRLGETKPGEETDPEYRKAANLIRLIRAQAAEECGDALLPYLISLYYYTIQGLAAFEPRTRPPAREIQVLLYRVLLAALLTGKIEQMTIDSAHPAERSGAPRLQLDESEHAVTLDGRAVHLTGKQFKLLVYLFQHAGSVCKREQILSALQYGDPGDETVQNMLDMDIKRLREKIDPNAKERSLLVTVRGVGYKLNL